MNHHTTVGLRLILILTMLCVPLYANFAEPVHIPDPDPAGGGDGNAEHPGGDYAFGYATAGAPELALEGHYRPDRARSGGELGTFDADREPG